MSKEAHFTLGGAVNIQNCRVRGTASPIVVNAQSLHPDYITMWGGFVADLTLDLFFSREYFSGSQIFPLRVPLL